MNKSELINDKIKELNKISSNDFYYERQNDLSIVVTAKGFEKYKVIFDNYKEMLMAIYNEINEHEIQNKYEKS